MTVNHADAARHPVRQPEFSLCKNGDQIHGKPSSLSATTNQYTHFAILERNHLIVQTLWFEFYNANGRDCSAWNSLLIFCHGLGLGLEHEI